MKKRNIYCQTSETQYEKALPESGLHKKQWHLYIMPHDYSTMTDVASWTNS